ncbi:beta-ketoacyl synthase chain length factor [Stenotrophomonas mori]|uniref:Beta-ketoacyl synthase chain length factor n=1 Tax=Stenotrophomonas mori TaxID=2871096 RepID=A0ABT0SHY9_9GAMM|nr:beta-ketoacyl synthase chain length factor [Stenotrophomonas mori]MCL7714688.1 beta-ketoacyl synthase chain length factor [Stenotrophomonas mori]
MIEFSVVGWSAWAPGLTDAEQWRAWAAAPWVPLGDEAPVLAEVPALQRRRIERLGRMAIQVACWCEPPGDHAPFPLVFASRHGDVARSLSLLEALVEEQAMSPTAFGLSVHNAVAAMYSIIRGDRGNYLALAAGGGTVEAACMEAAALLADGAQEVRVIAYEAPLPAVYSAFSTEPEAGFAWCWRLRPAGCPGVRVSLDWEAQAGPEAPTPALPRGLDAHRFLLAGEREYVHATEEMRWRWRRHA